MSQIIYPEESLVLAGCAMDCSECLAGHYSPRNFPPHKKWSSPTGWCDEPGTGEVVTP